MKQSNERALMDWAFGLVMAALIVIALMGGGFIPSAYGAEPPPLEKRVDKIIERIDAKNAELEALRTSNDQLRAQNSAQNIQVQYLQILAERNELGMRVLQLSADLERSNAKAVDLEKQLTAEKTKPQAPPAPSVIPPK